MTKKSEKTEKVEHIEKEQDKDLEQEEELKEGASAEDPEQEEEPGEEEEVQEEEEVKVPTAEEKLAELQNKYLRLVAEYDNFRKRTLKEKIDLQRSANEQLLGDLLPVADDFDRALQSVDDAKDIEAVKEGFKLIYGKFNGFLSQHGVKLIDAVNQEFDTDVHEAITKIPAPTKKLKGKVVDVVQKGYYLNDRVLRFAKVVIGD